MNKVVLSGRLTRDVESRESESGTLVARFNVAVSRNYKNKEGNYDADFISCVVYRNTAEFVAKYFHKGDGIIVEGRIQTGSYEAKDGVIKYTTDVIVENVEFNGKAKESAESEVAAEIPGNITSNYETLDNGVSLSDEDLPF